MKDLNNSGRQISRELGISKSTANDVLRRRIGNTSEQRKNTLRQSRKSSVATDQRIVRLKARDRFESLQKFYSRTQFNMSYWSIRRRLLQYGLKRHLAVQDVLTLNQKQQRIRWCQFLLSRILR